MFYGSGIDVAPAWSYGHPWLAILLSNIALGLAVGRWWAVLIPFALVGLSVPISDWHCDGGLECIGEPVAIWMFFGVLVIAIPCVGVGMLIRRLVEAQAEGGRFASRSRHYNAASQPSGDQNSSRLPAGS